MVSGAASLVESLAEPRPAPRRGRGVVEFLLVGGSTLVLLPLFWICRRAFGLDTSEFGVGFLAFHAAFVINDPHFSVTYLLFYRDTKNRAFGRAFDTAQRRRYLVAGGLVPLVLALWCALAIRSGSGPLLGSLIELMFFLVGWHYVKQGFGVLVVLSARSGFHFTGLERRVVLGHCFAGWAHAWANPATPAREVVEKGVVYVAIPRPTWLDEGTRILFFASALALAWILVRRWRRTHTAPPAAALVGLLCTVWVWTVYSAKDPLMVYVIPALHSTQYLFFVWLLRRNEALEAQGPPLFKGPVRLRLATLTFSALALGWVLFHGMPEFLDELIVPRSPGVPKAPRGGLGATPYFAAFFTFVNIHHYFMDHVLWRRDNPETRYLYTQLVAGSACHVDRGREIDHVGVAVR